MHYYNNGWHLLRIWEHEVNGSVVNTVDKVVQFIEGAKMYEKMKTIQMAKE
ncbi:hypothetical protein N781_08915 [Pontibacillus halophilus JSM 076056 = DSM 19796]|uniref:DUF559 domain-containing protein n=1 Tax=Pontibacillus halophilus JSM 076056 = DSM 19796 TaxID=1385510 RepID=A0A0A5GF32_9BACI|nr:very short patch repair endonuclease [Pontibacillus halophilus]KGX89828.1 hypothetical protein N781_08915 [Pontibacillus halophilus JSM 076056 = DSM 19796]